MKTLALVLATSWFAACTSGQVSGMKRHEFDLFSISVPTGWTQVVYGAQDRHKGRYGFGGPGVRFEGPGGEYLDIAPDLAIDGPSADAWWKARPTSDGGIDVQASEKLCVTQPTEPPTAQGVVPGLSLPECLVGDGRLDIALSFATRGHGYVVTFGNDRRERAEDMKPFEVILATFKAKQGAHAW